MLVWRDDICAVFLSNRPVRDGHALVVPVAEVDHWLDVPPDVLHHMTVIANRVGRAQLRIFEAQRIGLIMAGFEVPHCHLHVIPADSLDDLCLSHDIPAVTDNELHHNTLLLREAIAD